MKSITILIFILGLIMLAVTAAATVGGGPTDHLENPAPGYGEVDVVITIKGVQLCIDVVVDAGCTANVTFWWYNYSGGETGQWEFHGFQENIAVDTTICFWNPNVSCATENWWNEWFHWMVVGNFTCAGGNYSETAYLYFNAEDCPLFYIYPAWNDSYICSCCDAMCVGINNMNGSNMNISFYRNDSQWETFYLINQYLNVSNGTYCFCLDGHINNSLYYPMKYNESYHWYVNVTDVVTGEYNVSAIFNFSTAEFIDDCFCGNVSEAIEDIPSFYKPYIIGVLGLIGLAGLIGRLRRRKVRR